MSPLRPLTQDEVDQVPLPLTDLAYYPDTNTFGGLFGQTALFATQLTGPWLLEDGSECTQDKLLSGIPHSDQVTALNIKALTGQVRGKPVRFSRSLGSWVYQNNRPVNFSSPSANCPDPHNPRRIRTITPAHTPDHTDPQSIHPPYSPSAPEPYPPEYTETSHPRKFPSSPTPCRPSTTATTSTPSHDRPKIDGIFP